MFKSTFHFQTAQEYLVEVLYDRVLDRNCRPDSKCHCYRKSTHIASVQYRIYSHKRPMEALHIYVKLSVHHSHPREVIQREHPI